MNSNLYFKELKRNAKTLMIWSSIVIGFTLMVTAIFPYMADMGDSMSLLMENIPAEIGKAMGMDNDTWSSILGFYSTYYGIYIIVLISIYTASTGATIISKEEKDQTSEFLLTRPISRQTIVSSKLLALITLTLIIFMIQSITAVIGISAFSVTEVNWAVLSKMHASGLVIILFFTAVGVLISTFSNPKINFMGMVVGLTFGTYLLNAIGKSADAVSWISIISPFRYLEITKDPTVAFNFTAAIAMLFVVCVMFFVSNKVYATKDIDG